LQLRAQGDPTVNAEKVLSDITGIMYDEDSDEDDSDRVRGAGA